MIVEDFKKVNQKAKVKPIKNMRYSKKDNLLVINDGFGGIQNLRFLLKPV